MAIIDISSMEEFEKEVLQHEGKVLVDFWAGWCGPCKLVAPEVEKVADHFKDSLKVVKVNYDALPEIVMKYEVQGIPTLAVIDSGKEVDRIVGYRPASGIIGFIDSLK